MIYELQRPEDCLRFFVFWWSGRKRNTIVEMSTHGHPERRRFTVGVEGSKLGVVVLRLRLSWENVVISLMEADCFRYDAVAETRSVEVRPVRLGNKFPRSG